MFKPFDALTYNKKEILDGEDNWTWIIEDVGLWGAPNDGPHNEWQYFKKVYQDYTRNNHTVVQAGGACGMYPRLLANMFAHVYTFEPDYLNFHCLVNNCQNPNIIKINAALGNDHRMIQMDYANRWNSGMHQVNKNVTGYIPQLKIDDFEFESLDLIALDVESYEFNVLKGAEIILENIHL